MGVFVRQSALWVFVVVLLAVTLLNVAMTFLRPSCPPSMAAHDYHGLIFPYHQGLSEEEFSSMQQYYTTNYLLLKTAINVTELLSEGESYSYYFESLNTGSWVGYNE